MHASASRISKVTSAGKRNLQSLFKAFKSNGRYHGCHLALESFVAKRGNGEQGGRLAGAVRVNNRFELLELSVWSNVFNSVTYGSFVKKRSTTRLLACF
ncbi:hypothetical protein L6452_14323 [Arctium lappa]|uniref:Uncharacterized protein n=1 Tax=Arctium lappa TaxID=4217 RepID=A0ACB9CKJ8_ARCLA|nr:hypothetical protein L6452_14323 [Arctium lappa]